MIVYGSKSYIKVFSQEVLSEMLVGVLDLFLITVVFRKIPRQPKNCVLYFSLIQQMVALK